MAIPIILFSGAGLTRPPTGLGIKKNRELSNLRRQVIQVRIIRTMLKNIPESLRKQNTDLPPLLTPEVLGSFLFICFLLLYFL